MAKPQRKALAALQRRVKAWQATEDRQSRNNFRPNATGPMHKQHCPGSMNRKKTAPQGRSF